MANILRVRNLTLGRGGAKICVPLVSSSLDELKKEVVTAKNCICDLVEWRMDHYKEKDYMSGLNCIREALGDMPLIATIRTKRDGGDMYISPFEYKSTYKALIDSGKVDFIDCELSAGSEIVEELLEYAGENGVYTIISYHNFKETPSTQDIIEIFRQMKNKRGDICKIAVMPKSREDVLNLMGASMLFSAENPDAHIISMSMGNLGAITRLACDITGSCITFASASGASAPGQMDITLVKRFMENNGEQ